MTCPHLIHDWSTQSWVTRRAAHHRARCPVSRTILFSSPEIRSQCGGVRRCTIMAPRTVSISDLISHQNFDPSKRGNRTYVLNIFTETFRQLTSDLDSTGVTRAAGQYTRLLTSDRKKKKGYDSFGERHSNKIMLPFWVSLAFLDLSYSKGW